MVILTGRHIAGIRQILPADLPVTVVGSHGAEPGPTLSAADLAYLDNIEAQLAPLATDGEALEEAGGHEQRGCPDADADHRQPQHP